MSSPMATTSYPWLSYYLSLHIQYFRSKFIFLEDKENLNWNTMLQMCVHHRFYSVFYHAIPPCCLIISLLIISGVCHWRASHCASKMFFPFDYSQFREYPHVQMCHLQYLVIIHTKSNLLFIIICQLRNARTFCISSELAEGLTALHNCL